MRGSEYAELTAFATVAAQGSFVRAAAQLRISPSALSQIIRGLEERLGVRLLNRTTRSVAPSDAGARLLARITPVMNELDAAVAEVNTSRDRVAGSLRINTPRTAAVRLLGPLVGPFHEKYPDIELDIVVQEAMIDIVAERFDAGIRFAEQLAKDMVAIKLSDPIKTAVVASPKYLARHGIPKTPRDLMKHRCINWRWTTNGSLYRWELERGKRRVEIAVEGPLSVNDMEVMFRAALDGVGLAYLFDDHVRPWVEKGKLVRVLEAWSRSLPGFYLYYPSRSHMSPPLRAFVEFLRENASVPTSRRNLHREA
ncbi:LysR family transcriptional regulator [Pendulispora brunnea]|uniref:LysR family transcriptional regulator n=1 Tax=Pendulispora brunnea TaxID=2905690 RepID=A0ABZ2JUC9_9BACT